ncbi:MAG: hypothetical protein UE295_05525 [Acutalibacteraceae bacterium]|nr:hypothetical protein [Acutalibacteraceae bacterium]
MKNIFKKIAGATLAIGMMCAMPFSAFATESDIELTQQTLVDEVTNIKVTGMLPQGAQLCTVMSLIDFESLGGARLDEDEDVKHYMYKEFTASDYAQIFNRREYNKAENIQEYYPGNMVFDVDTLKDCSEWALSMLWLNIGFVKDGAVLDVDSELTVTLPFDFREALTKCGADSNATAFELEMLGEEEERLNELEVIAKDKTEKGTFQYKINGDGVYFIGNDYEMQCCVSWYTDNPANIFAPEVAERISKATEPPEVDQSAESKDDSSSAQASSEAEQSTPYTTYIILCALLGVAVVVVIAVIVKKSKKK